MESGPAIEGAVVFGPEAGADTGTGARQRSIGSPVVHRVGARRDRFQGVVRPVVVEWAMRADTASDDRRGSPRLEIVRIQAVEARRRLVERVPPVWPVARPGSHGGAVTPSIARTVRRRGVEKDLY